MRCATGKLRYRDELGAKLVLATIAQRDNPRRPKTEARAYRCPICHGWHLTSAPKRGRA